MRSTLEILKAARDRIANPERWCRGVMAVDDDKEIQNPTSFSARSWCAIGSICAEIGSMDGVATTKAVRVLLPDCNDDLIGHLSGINDHDGHAAVLALFDAAIARLS